jgi:hypothetical protein
MFTASATDYASAVTTAIWSTAMGDPKTNNPPSSGERAGETRLRGGSLNRDEQRTEVDRTAREKSEDTDDVLRTDDEEDTLYEDGLELENDSRPLTGINGKDDSR